MNYRYLFLLTMGHLFTDLNQGALPALLPFMISYHGLNYAAAAGLIFAANFLSSVVQPIFGVMADKHAKAWMMILGIFLAGFGIGLSSYIPNYLILFFIISISGLGVAMFHPEGALLANKLAGQKKASGLSLFALGGNGGYAFGPIIATVSILNFGFHATIILFFLSLFMAIILLPHIPFFDKILQSPKETKTLWAKNTKNQIKAFFILTMIVFCRSGIFFGLNTFIPLFWIHHYHASQTEGSIALTIFFLMGTIGTILGGNLADRLGYVNIVRSGFILLLPALLAFPFINNQVLAMIFLLPIGFAVYMAFSPMVVLGQKYLPNSMGLASGITIGLAVSVGGIIAPLLGVLADSFGLISAFYAIAIIPLIAVPLSFCLPKD
ncbi:MFS transporter, FSR family, fosmidomycin resistance protein [Thermodesulfobium acidiphilum]|uniref:MFS transporter, FSR family, fosmidomycin resistance protein n=1 Tax=Thermodesulfobium acidiphilum TaxID=1794699 RepID=A0A2R4VY49_THEAF|nr:MFS transporter [Thermodesulfobium acidiphilum]AWB09422.1 MFS transporter, FSR family, fosmidomycin resistance protein [Thermodesulfobium acidiphilum]